MAANQLAATIGMFVRRARMTRPSNGAMSLGMIRNCNQPSLSSLLSDREEHTGRPRDTALDVTAGLQLGWRISLQRTLCKLQEKLERRGVN